MGSTHSNTNTNTNTNQLQYQQQLANSTAHQFSYDNTNEPAECTACNDKQHTLQQYTHTNTNNNITSNNHSSQSHSSSPQSPQPCLSYSHSGCPLSRAEVGRAAWAYLHTVAAYYPIHPTKQQKHHMTEYMRHMTYTYPCSYCADESSKYINKPHMSIELHCNSRDELSLWLCDVHNEVNERLGKPVFDCRYVIDRWRTGPKDGTCD